MGGGTAIGIDLGTTYTCAAIMDKGGPRVISSRLGYTTIPSVLTYDDEGQPVVGQQAERRMILNPADTIYGSKRLLGRSFRSGVHMEFQPHYHYELVPGEDGLVAAEIKGMMTSLIEVAALILLECRKAAEENLGRPVDRAVVTVPAYFNEVQRACVRKAGRFAGLKIIRILNEPTAAALAYGARGEEPKRLLVFDLGGGTFDVSVVRAKNNLLVVEAVDGDSFLGGIDFDHLIVGHLVDRLSERYGTDIELSKIDRERLRKEAQQAKHELSSQERSMITLPHVELGDGQVINVDETLSRAGLEEATGELVDHCLATVERTLKRLQLTPADIDAVLLVGGQTRMPLVQQKLADMFGKPPSKRVHPDEAVAIGAAIAAYAADDASATQLVDVVPMSIVLAIAGGAVRKVVEAGTPLPHSTTLKFEIPPKTETIRLPVIQGDEPRARDNEYLGALVLDGLGGSKEPSVCTLEFKLDRECILGVVADIPAWGSPQFVELDRSVAFDELLASLGDPDASAAPSDDSSAVVRKPRRGLAGKILGRLRRRRKRR